MPDSLIAELQDRVAANEKAIASLTRVVADLTAMMRENAETTTRAIREQSEQLKEAIVQQGRATREMIRGMRT